MTSVVPYSRFMLEEEVDHAVAGAGVEAAGGLVGEEQLRAHDEGARERHALLLAAGEVLGIVVQPLAQADALEHLARQFLRLIRI